MLMVVILPSHMAEDEGEGGTLLCTISVTRVSNVIRGEAVVDKYSRNSTPSPHPIHIFMFIAVVTAMLCTNDLHWVLHLGRDGKSVKNSTDEYSNLEIAHKMRISQHITLRAKTG